MGTIEVRAERLVHAPAHTVYDCIADMHQRVCFLPPAFSDFHVEQGGVGAGSLTRFKMTAGGRRREYHMRVDEPEPGRVLRESDLNSTLVRTLTVDPEGDRSRVQILTTWQGAGGIGGVFERLFAPHVLRRIYTEELKRLSAHARTRAAETR